MIKRCTMTSDAIEDDSAPRHSNANVFEDLRMRYLPFYANASRIAIYAIDIIRADEYIV